MAARSRNSFLKIINALVIIGLMVGIAAISVKMIVCGYVADDAYHVVMSYRQAIGDRLFMEMWEPHQTSAFLSAALIKLFMTATGSVESVVIFLRVCGLCCHAIVAFVLFMTVRKLMGLKEAFLLAVLFYASFPKLTAIPEFSNMQLWFVTLSLCMMLKAYEKKFDKPVFVILSATFLCLSIITYPTGIIVAVAFCVALLINRDSRNMKGFGCFVITCFAEGVAYLAAIFAGKDFKTVISNIGNVLSGDSSHMSGVNVMGESTIASFFSGFGMLLCFGLAVIMLSSITAFIIGKIRKGTGAYELCITISVIICSLITAYYVFVKQMGYDCYKLQFVVLPVEALLGAVIVKKEKESGLRGFWLLAIVSGILVFAAVVAISNLEAYVNLPLLQVALIWSIVAIFAHFSHKNILFYGLLFMAVVTIGVTGYTQKTSGIGRNIFQYNAIIADGPAKGIRVDWVVMERYKSGNADMKQIVGGDESVLVVSNDLYATPTELYMAAPLKISQYSTICTPTFGEKHLDYWAQFPDRLPALIVLEKEYEDYAGEQFIYNWLMENYEFEPVYIGDFYTFCRRVN